MSDLVRVDYEGGPAGPFCAMTPPTMLYDRVSLFSGKMIVEHGEGVAITNSEVVIRSRDWISYTRHVYEKAGELQAGRITYRYVATVEVTRCQARTKTGKQCRHEARPGEQFCNVHRKSHGAQVST